MSAQDTTDASEFQDTLLSLARGTRLNSSKAEEAFRGLVESWGMPTTRVGPDAELGANISLVRERMLDGNYRDPQTETWAEREFGSRRPFLAGTAASAGANREGTAVRSAFDAMNERATIDANNPILETASPVEVDPQIVEVLRSRAPIRDRITTQAQAGFKARYNTINDRSDPLGMLSESDDSAGTTTETIEAADEGPPYYEQVEIEGPDTVAVGEDFTLERVNPAYEEDTGLSAESICGRSIREVFGEDGDRIEEKYTECVKKEEPLEYDEEVRLDGELTHWETKIAPVVLNGEVEYVVGSTRDVTEQKERKKELTRSKKFLERSSDAVMHLDEDGEILHQTPGPKSIVGGDPGSDVGDNGLEYIHPEDRQEVAKKLEEVTNDPDESLVSAEFRVETPDEGYIWTEAAVTDQTDTELGGVIVSLRDITERKEQQKELKETQERLDLAVEAAGLGVWDWDMESGEIQHNEQWAEMFGLPPEEGTVSVESIRERSHPDRVPELEEVIEEVITGERNRYDIEIRRKTAGGDWKWVRTVGQVAERDENGKATRLVGVNIDIDELKRQKKELERYKTFIESSPDVITHLGVDGEILYQSPSVERIGYSQDESVGDTAFEYVHPDDREKAQQEFFEVLEDPEKDSGMVEYRVLNGEGEYVWTEAVGKDQRDTEAGGVVINQRDITERKRKEKRLKEFASVVSHDLRNPLSVAKGRLELAQKECDSDQLDSVEGALERMDALIEDILSLAREGSDIGETEVIETDEMIEECWENVETEGAMIVNELEGKLEADPRRLKQVCENLVRNAVEHAGEGVTVTVGELEDGNGFYIADDGEGIPEEERDDVFDTGYSTSEHGTGFGLSIVEEIVTAHGWSIDVTESKDGGARFEVSGAEMPKEA